MQRIALKNGHVLALGNPGFVASISLFKTICRELKAADVDVSQLKSLQDVKDLDLSVVKDAVLQLLGSDKLEQAIFDCLVKSTIEVDDSSQTKPEAITRNTFTPDNMRGDFFPVAWEVIKNNVGPFFANLDFPSIIPAAVPLNGRP